MDLCSFLLGSYWNERVTDLGQRVLLALSVVGAGLAVILTSGPVSPPEELSLGKDHKKPPRKKVRP